MLRRKKRFIKQTSLTI